MSNPPELIFHALNSPLAEDLPCLHCSYNLRTRLPTDRCPECNTPVHLSIEFERSHRGFKAGRLALVALLTLAFFTLGFVLQVATTSITMFFWGAPGSFTTPTVYYGLNVLQQLLAVAGVGVEFTILWTLVPLAWRKALPALLYFFSIALYILGGLLSIMVGAYLIAIISGWKTGPISAPVSIISYGTSLIQGVAYVILQVYAALFLLELAKRPDYRALRSWVLPIFGAHLFTLLVSIAQSALLLLIFLLAPPTSRTWLSIVGQVNSWLRLLVLAALLILWFQVFRLARRHRSAARAP